MFYVSKRNFCTKELAKANEYIIKLDKNVSADGLFQKMLDKF